MRGVSLPAEKVLASLIRVQNYEITSHTVIKHNGVWLDSYKRWICSVPKLKKLATAFCRHKQQDSWDIFREFPGLFPS